MCKGFGVELLRNGELVRGYEWRGISKRKVLERN